MSRKAARFTQADVARAIKAIQQTGANMMVEIGLDGVIRILQAPEPEKSQKAEETKRRRIVL